MLEGDEAISAVFQNQSNLRRRESERNWFYITSNSFDKDLISWNRKSDPFLIFWANLKVVLLVECKSKLSMFSCLINLKKQILMNSIEIQDILKLLAEEKL